MAGDNPTLKSAEEATGLQPLNEGPNGPQPPQHQPLVSDPTLDTIPPALRNLHSPFQSFVLGLDTRDSREKNKNSVSPATYPSESEFEDLVRAGLKPEGPVRAEEVQPGNVNWPDGYREIVKLLEGTGEETAIKVYKVVEGQHKAEMFVVSLDIDNERLVGIRFPVQ